jgi:carbon starvation protein
VFIWLALLYVIIAFADITASTFVSKPEELANIKTHFHPGGAVAASSIFYLILSMVLGLTDKFLKPPTWLTTIIFVPLIAVCIWLGTIYSQYFVLDVKIWAILIMIYCALGSVMPVWLLLQPRGFLGGFVLYAVLILGVIGIFFGNYEIKQPVFTSFDLGTSMGTLFPFLFVTIACGACSGFHGLVCSGTTSKQIDKEKHCHTIGYGAMLAEAFVAFIALTTIMIMAPEEVKGMKPGAIYGRGIGEYLTLIIGKENLEFAITLGAMAFSTFVFDTLDVATRLGRYLIQELISKVDKTGAAIGILLTAGIPSFALLTMEEGGWIKFWTLFGASNQLLAALTLLSVTVWLYESRKRIFFTLIPMIFILLITLVALFKIAKSNYVQIQGFDANLLNSLVSISLILLAIFICFQAISKVRSKA